MTIYIDFEGKRGYGMPIVYINPKTRVCTYQNVGTVPMHFDKIATVPGDTPIHLVEGMLNGWLNSWEDAPIKKYTRHPKKHGYFI